MKCPLFLTLPLSIPSINNNSNNNSTIHEQALLNEYYILRTQRYLELYSTLLAIRHVNERNGTFVEWLSNITSVCPNNDDFSIPYVFLSDNDDAERNFIAHEFNVTSNGQNYVHFDNNYDHDDVSFCGIIGPVDSNYAAQISRLKRDLLNYDEIDLVQVTPYAFIDENHENLNSKLIRVSAGAETIASRLYDYLITTLGRDYIAILSDSVEENFGKIFADNVNLTSRGTTIEFALYDGQASLEYSANHPHHVYNALELVADSKFSTIVLVEGSQAHALLPQIISKADELGLISRDHMWIIVPHELSSGLEYYKHVHSNADPDSLEEKFLRGLQFFDYSNVNLSTKFSNHLLRDESLDSDIVNIISTFSPAYFNTTEIRHVRTKSYVNLTNAGLLFDSVLRFFLNFCGQFSNLRGITSMIDVLDNNLEDNSEGAFFILNLETNEGKKKMPSLLPVAFIDNGAWLAFGNASYHDGSNNPPDALRTVEEDMNYLSSIYANFVYGAIILNLLIGLMMGYNVNKRREQLKSRTFEPWYLHILIITAVISSLSLLAFVVDERLAPHNFMLNVMCYFVLFTTILCSYFTYYAFYVKLTLLQKELATGEKHCISSVFFDRKSWLPIVTCIALMLRLVLISFLSWQRTTMRIDEYGFVVESKGHCVYIDISAQLVFCIFVLLLLCGVLLYIYIQIIRSYQSMDTLMRRSKFSLMKQSKQVIQCTIFKSSTLLIWLVSKMIGCGNQDYATSRIIISVINSTSVYLFIVFPALMCTWSQIDPNEATR